MPAAPSPYDAYRTISYSVALLALPTTLQHHVLGRFAGVPIALREVDNAALDEWDAHWKGSASRRVAWDWRRIDTRYETLLDDRFELAVWSGAVLCGLAAGTPRFGRMEVDLAEGSPGSRHPLKGATRFAVIEAARAYTMALGHSELRHLYRCRLVVGTNSAEGSVRTADQRGDAKVAKGATLPSAGRSANVRSRTVSGSLSVGSRASAERRKRTRGTNSVHRTLLT